MKRPWIIDVRLKHSNRALWIDCLEMSLVFGKIGNYEKKCGRVLGSLKEQVRRPSINGAILTRYKII